MPSLPQLEEMIARLLKGFERRQQRLSNLQTFISLLAGWLAADLVTPATLFHTLHALGL